LLPVTLSSPEAEGSDLGVDLHRAGGEGERTVHLRSVGEDGRLLSRHAVTFGDGALAAKAVLDLPLELRNRLARLEVEGQETAASVALIDERWRRRPVGLVTAGAQTDQPLLSESHFLKRALDPFTEVRTGRVRDLLETALAVIVVPDEGRMNAAERRALETWVQEGGIVLRFAGPHLAETKGPPAGEGAEGQSGGGQGADLLPVELRGGRALGGAMSWDKPATLAPFTEDSPFFGLAVPPDVLVRRQVLAQPSLDLPDRTWARLSDGTPLVTARAEGQGRIVLVHTTANTAWANLSISGLFVQMLRRVIGLSQGVAGAASGPPLRPYSLLDGFGRLAAPPDTAMPVAAKAFDDTRPGPAHPPGYYGDGAARRALNLTPSLGAVDALAPLPGGIDRRPYGPLHERDFRPWLLSLALVLALADMAASLALRGVIRVAAALALVVLPLAAGLLVPGAAQAQSPGEIFAQRSSLTTRLAFLMTGDPGLDDTSRAGLVGLSAIVNQRTAAELGDPVGLDPERDELSFFPFIYWPVRSDQPPLTTLAAERLQTYMRNGGTLLIDTRSQGGAPPGGVLERMGRQLDVPPLTPVDADHVLGRSYYLLKDFPGRWNGGRLWVVRPDGQVNDGVSTVVLGGNDWAGAWAVDEAHRPLFAVVPGGERQREMAYRFGINMVMYTLTGNYKADQVHLPAIINRLGQ
ncbi:MAG: DUF4159 domain-containing protein, partial [Rhodobacterales bacterium]|nr:DUF4159 domain-containing protein [Rhodobacterales bacterium]